ncbi:MAG: Na+/H+ antiporter [Puniceicoccales bacterium]|jgi:CPA1 family monovalent cation:H+ antiporter|nr:Na+/H+ antiporter [Puniceicoccales bacterium]
MNTVFLVLLFLSLVGLSNVLRRFVPLPLPLVQIALGAALAALPTHYGIHVSLDPELFMFLFIPPLLFSDGWRIPKRELFRLRYGVLMLAFGLVFFTVAGAGYFIHWLIPAISLPAAFALAGVLSPTDAVAVTSITGQSRMPSRLQHILEGESLLNDASGLVAFKFALAAIMTGMFSFKEAAASFVFISLGGFAVGVILALAIDWGRHHIVHWWGESGGTFIILTLLLPFVAYLVAEHLGCSGILAAVAAGITMNYTTFGQDSALETRIQNAAIWGMLEMAFNGIIFLLLGLQLPGILSMASSDAMEAGHNSPWILPWYILAITVVLFALRFFWVLCSVKLTLFQETFKKQKLTTPFGLRLITVTSLSGVRGAVTLAGILSIPLLMPDGTNFPARNLMVFLAAGVILLTLIIASSGLPFLLKKLKMPQESEITAEVRTARRFAAEAAVKALENEKNKKAADVTQDTTLQEELCERILAIYQQRLVMLGDDKDTMESALQASEMETQLRLLAIRAERSQLIHLYDTHQINNQTLDKLVRDTDMREAALSGIDIGRF